MARGGNNSGGGVVTTRPMEDTFSPYFLHPADHPGLVLVTHPLSGTGANHNTWKRSMLMALAAKNKAGFVDGSIPCPESTDLLFAAWSRCNNMVSSWVLNSVDKEVADSLLYLPMASGIWDDLKERFLQSNRPQIFQIEKALTGLQQGSMNVSTYYTKLKILWDELKEYQPVSKCYCGEMKHWIEYQEQEFVMQFLMGLNDSFTQTRAQILMIEPPPTITKVFSLVIQEERQRTINHNLLPPVSESVIPIESPTVNAAVGSSGSGNLTSKQRREK